MKAIIEGVEVELSQFTVVANDNGPMDFDKMLQLRDKVEGKNPYVRHTKTFIEVTGDSGRKPGDYMEFVDLNFVRPPLI